MKINVQFILSKGDGDWPDLDTLPGDKKNINYLTSCMKFMPAFEEVESVIISWAIIDSGLGGMTFSDGELKGYPTPVVEFHIDKKKYDELFQDSKEFLRGVWESTYQFAIPGINDEDAFYFADFNGYTHIL
jgi:hypothetical protein